MSSMRRSIGRAAILFAATAGAACGSDSGGDSSGGPDPVALSAARSEPSGDGQSGTAGQDLANPLRIVVLRGSAPEAGAVVTWSTAGTGATLTPSTSTTGPDGISSSVWHLGTQAGAQSAQAVVARADGSPVKFAATAAAPGGGPAPVGIQLISDGTDRFEPANVTIPVGTTVTWTWVSGFHNVTPTGAPEFTGSGQPVSAPHTFSQTFNSAGTYLYFCVVHGSPTAGMRGTIVVQ
ncbi:MAG: plastocyanin/azurin family copper-binding protein [Gemmatimonadales bacterium]